MKHGGRGAVFPAIEIMIRFDNERRITVNQIICVFGYVNQNGFGWTELILLGLKGVIL